MRQRWGGVEDVCREISVLSSHFRVALCCSLFCKGVEFESKYKTQFLVSLGEEGGELQRNLFR